MKSRRPTAIAVARERDTSGPLYALIGDDSPIPDISLLDDDWTPFMPQRGTVQQIGDPVMLDSEYEAGDYFEHADEPDTLVDGSDTRQPYRAGPGTITLYPHSVPTFAGNFADHFDLAFVKLLASGCLVRSGVTTRTLTATGSNDDNEWLCAAVPGDMHVGQVITRTVGGRRYGSMVSGLAAGTVRQIVPLGTALANEDVVQLCQTFDFGKPTSSLSLGDSVVVRMDGAGVRDYCYGGRWSELNFTMNKRTVQAAFNMSFDLIIDDSGDASVTAGTNTDAIPYEPAGARIFTWAGTRPQLGSTPSFDRQDPTIAAPVMVGSERLYVDEVTVKVTNTLGRRGDFDGLGPGPQEVDAVTVEISLMLSRETADLDALRARLWEAHNNYLPLVLPMAPSGQHGGSWVVPAAVLKTDVRRFDFAKDYYRVPLVFGLGPNVAEDSGGTAPLKLGLA